MSGKKSKQAFSSKKVIPGFTPVIEGTSHTSLKDVPKKTFNEARKEKKKLLQINQARNASTEFKTDSEVTGNKDLKERKLVKWSASDDSNKELYQSLEDLSVSHEKFDQFEANRKQFQIESSYDESFYNAKIDTNSEDYKKKMEAAIKMESEILNDPSMNLKTGNQHIDEERGLVDMKEYVDEESKYSQVVTNEKNAEQKLSTPSPISKKAFSGAQLLKSIQKPQSPISPSGVGRDVSPGNDINFNKSNILNPRKGKKIISKLHLKGKDETVKELQAFSKSFHIPERLNKMNKTELNNKSKSFFDPELNPLSLGSDMSSEPSNGAKLFNYFKNMPNEKTIPKSFASPVVFNNHSTKKYRQILSNSKYFKRRFFKHQSSFYPAYPGMEGHPPFFANVNGAPRNGSFSMNSPAQMVQVPMFIPSQAVIPDQKSGSQINSRSGSFNMPPQFNAQSGMYVPPVNYYMQMPMMPVPVMMGNTPPHNKKFQGHYDLKKKLNNKNSKSGNKKENKNFLANENK
ncbi:uncharacterized protein HGUI_00014 [Hanseniaspora guilliermondii]|uniref:LsmAD domain-containing protein n=1 Tax=Hanseniaspora guilliermondii TaxID=56406 RepID=A0A1L0FDX6_9ASCO|nr:uncharacterized protein HGUI_00014 [Hanseniaspora guilliermondii]